MVYGYRSPDGSVLTTITRRGQELHLSSCLLSVTVWIQLKPLLMVLQTTIKYAHHIFSIQHGIWLDYYNLTHLTHHLMMKSYGYGLLEGGTSVLHQILSAVSAVSEIWVYLRPSPHHNLGRCKVDIQLPSCRKFKQIKERNGIIRMLPLVQS